MKSLDCNIRKLAVLDDDLSTMNLLKRKWDKFNQYSKNKVYVDYYSEPKEFLSNFDHDWALVDLHLANSEVDGFDIAREILQKFPATAIVTSSDIRPEEDFDSLLRKENIRASEIFQRFWRLDRNQERNVLQIFMRAGDFKDGRL